MTSQELAAQDYAAGMKYKDIAEKYDVSLNTVKSWRKRHGWTRGAPPAKEGAPTPKKGAERVHPSEVAKKVAQADLPERQELFARLYMQSFNATKAYMQAYGAKYDVANTNGPALLVKTGMRKLIDELKAEHAAQLDITTIDIMQDLAKQVRGDIGDYVEFGTVDVKLYSKNGEPLMNSETGNQETTKQQFVNPKDSEQVDTSLIKSVHQGRDGLVIELYDKQKAMDMLLKGLPDATISSDSDDGLIDALKDAGKKAWGMDDADS